MHVFLHSCLCFQHRRVICTFTGRISHSPSRIISSGMRRHYSLISCILVLSVIILYFSRLSQQYKWNYININFISFFKMPWLWFLPQHFIGIKILKKVGYAKRCKCDICVFLKYAYFRHIWLYHFTHDIVYLAIHQRTLNDVILIQQEIWTKMNTIFILKPNWLLWQSLLSTLHSARSWQTTVFDKNYKHWSAFEVQSIRILCKVERRSHRSRHEIRILVPTGSSLSGCPTGCSLLFWTLFHGITGVRRNSCRRLR